MYPLAYVQVRQQQSTSDRYFNLIILFWLLHIPLGLIIYLGPSILATLHGVGTVAVAGLWAVSPGIPRVRIAYAGAYIIGSEVLWRMAGAILPWEFGKYALILICLLGILRDKRMKLPIAPTLYFLFLLPAIFPTIDNLSLGEAREQISFNLSGPFAIVVSASLFLQLDLSQKNTETLLIVLVGPVISLSAILLYVVTTSSQIIWTNDSNFITSGGYGPNQVSTTLGLGLTSILLLIFIVEQRTSGMRLFFITLGVWFLSQGLLTFSRGGVMVGAIAAAVAFIMHLRTDDKARFQQLVPLILLILISIYLVIPALDSFTGGALQNRFTDFAAGGRENIVEVDLQTFFDNPLTGVGVGQAKSVRYSVLEKASASHTEYSRVLAEHGLMGLLAYVLLGNALVSNIIRSSGIGRILIIALSLWAILTMFHAAMRLAAPSFAIGLSFATFIQNYEEDTASR